MCKCVCTKSWTPHNSIVGYRLYENCLELVSRVGDSRQSGKLRYYDDHFSFQRPATSDQRPGTSSARPPSRIKTRRTTDENNETVWLRFANAPATVSHDEKDYASGDYARCFVFSNYFLRVSFPTDSIVGPTKRLFVAVNRILILLKVYEIVSETGKVNLSFKLLIS